MEKLTCSNPKCIHHGEEQDVSNFRPRKSKRGYSSWCKDCLNQSSREKSRKFQKKNKDNLIPKIKFKKCSNKDCPNGPGLQPVENFYVDNSKKSGFSYRCKLCESNYRKSIYNKERSKKIKNSPVPYKTYEPQLRKYHECKESEEGFLMVRCKYCNKFFKPIRDVVDRRILGIKGKRKSLTEFYCSRVCKRSCPIFNQTKYPRGFKPATSREVQPELRKMVLERDNWTCQKCGKSKEEFPELELHCHHIDPVVNNPIESADEDNCVTLCKDCHIFVHTEIPGCSLGDLIKCSKNKK